VVEGLLVDRELDEVALTLSRLPKIDNPILKAVKNRVVLSSVCPEPGTHLTNRGMWKEIEVISVAKIEELIAI
jgi:hypothetical protein